MDLIYLDYNCFQRAFDDPKQIRIQMEALACQEIFSRAENNLIQLVWSFMHEDETILCPFPERKYEVLRLSQLCKIRVGPHEAIYNLAKSFQNTAKLSSKDAVHLACAGFIKADYFLTCDQILIKLAQVLKPPATVINPMDYISQRIR